MKNILVVDNDRFFLEFIEEVLEKEGHSVKTAKDGLAALDALEGFKPDFIFSDAIMPNIDGKRLCRMLRRMDHLRDTKIVIVSSVIKEDADELKKCGADSFISKGPLTEMAGNILDFLQPGVPSLFGTSGEFIGKTRLKPRAITRELLSVNQHLELLLDRLSEAIFEIMPDGRMVYANSAATRLTGISEEGLLGRLFQSLFSGDDRTRIETLLAKIGENPGKIFDDPLPSVNDAEVLLELIPLSAANGKIMAIVENVKEQKAAQRANEELQKELRQSQKLESVGRLAGGVAHDFNNNLAVILGYTELILSGINSRDSYHKEIEKIHEAAERSAALTKQLLAFARKQTISPRVLDLNEAVEGMLKMLRRLIGENIELKWHPDTKLWSVRMDPNQIGQILANLCVNAADAIEGAGKILIETKNVIIDNTYCSDHKGCLPGEYAMLVLTDDGSGMDRETVAHVFEPFFTTKEVGAGTGLGLATVYGIVKQNNGFINVYSEPGSGTCFKIYLPTYQEAITDNALTTSPVPIQGRGETILLVEDDPGLLEMGMNMLENLGYAVISADRPDKAIGIARECADPIHLLMTDVVMPVMSGKELARQLSQIRPEVRILFTSGYTADVIAQQGVLDDDVCFIEKPFSIFDLATKVSEVLQLAS